MDQLFVYGTLQPGEYNHGVMEAIPGKWQRATINGILYTSDWGASHNCPGVIVSTRGNVIPGYLFKSDALHLHWNRLDDFEGSAYTRATTPVTLASGESTTAFVYAISGHLAKQLQTIN